MRQFGHYGLIVCVVLSLGVVGRAVLGANASPPNTLTEQELADGWILLFDGATLFGWRPTSNANWGVTEGAISVSQGEPGLLATTSQFGDCVLKVDFRAAKGTNSGVFVQTPSSPGPMAVAQVGYEVNIAPADNPFPTGSLVQRQRAEQVAETADWRTLEVDVEAGRVQVRLDGKQVLDYTDPKPVRRGHIGLQCNQGRVEFRNVKLKPKGLVSLFNGKDLSGWKLAGASQAQITPDGWLHLTGGKGQLESDRQFADFTFQLEIFVNGAGLNSGVFFRSIPGEMWNGYESQIHNGFRNNDRTQPLDAGTGAIFRRQNARRVVANDRQWFYKTIHADGPHMAVWVNGYQVTDWTDTRPLADNPRKGLRLKPGTLILQGHDPTTDLYFRNLRIAALSAGLADRAP